ncbi:AAA family ATPase [Massilibacteroides sp.]|uniref:AAA family ATPase n=1 Tax=Massilibacteroides sp. TaxID=2034766 RepID=UPI0026197F6A|nr:AAA family ATPase [Massilibacteroides sp.]MDD4516362.1 AAA family ATPase [Massilibacteroides sp.]
MAVINIFNIPKKTTVNVSMQAKSFIICGKSKAGKSTLCTSAPKPIFLMTENGTEGLAGFTPLPIGSWADFKQAVSQLCMPQARELYETVVIDSYTNLILLLDKYIGQKMTTEKNSFDFGSDVDYGKGTKALQTELGFQLQRLANQGYILLNIVHAEDKVDFETQKAYIGVSSISKSLYGVAEKFVDQIVYLRREKPDKVTGISEHRIWFNAKGGFVGAGGRWTPKVDSVYCSYKNFEEVMLKTIEEDAKEKNAEIVHEDKPAVAIIQDSFDFTALKSEFDTLTKQLVEESRDNAVKIKEICEKELGVGRKVSSLGAGQAELLSIILNNIKIHFNQNNNLQ